MEKSKFLRSILLFMVVIIPITSGLYIRFDDLGVWQRHKSQFFYKDRPLFTSYDAFCFARYGKEYLTGNYKSGERDPLRFIPDNYLTDNVTYPSLIPMESWLGAQLAKLEKTHIENISIWLIPILSVLFVIPLVLYFYEIDLPIAGFGGALLGAVSFIYLTRTSIVRFDTDALNLFFPFAIAFFLLRSFYSKGRGRYLELAIAGIVAQAYCWWYAHTGLMLVVLLTYAAGLFLFEKEDNPKQKALYLLVLFVFSNPVFVFSGVFNLVGSVKTYLINYFRPAISGFPNVLMSISEAQHFDIIRTARSAAGNFVLFAVGFAGAILLFIRRFKETFLLLPVFLIGAVSLKGGNRFIMYLSPFIGIGVGYLFDRLVAYLREKGDISHYNIYALRFLSILLLTGVFLYTNRPSFAFVAKPKLTPELEKNFIKLENFTPKNSWIWTWWDYGYAIEYLAGRAVFHDGGSQSSPKTYFVAASFSTPNPQIAHNIILGISNTGAEWIKKALKKKEKAERIKDLIFSGAFSKPVNRPIYWAFTGDEITKFTWINYFGTWDFDLKKGIKSSIYVLSGCRSLRPQILACGNLIVDLDKGEIVQGKRGFLLKEWVIKDGDKLIEKDFHPKGLYIEVVKKDGRSYLFLTNEQPFKSMFNQMYILRNFDKRYFELVYDDFPAMVLYRVSPHPHLPAKEGE